MDSGIRQPSQRLMTLAWEHAHRAAAMAMQHDADAEQVLHHCQALIAELPDAQQRQVINALAAGRYERRILDRVKRGSATTSGEAAIDGAATDPAPFGGESGCRVPATDSARNPDSGTVAAAWNLP